jgi:hypothetical protein
VAEALTEEGWISDIQGNLSMVGLYEFFQPWDALQEINFSSHEDEHNWWFSSSGCYSTKLAYRAFFHGSVAFEPWKLIWKS